MIETASTHESVPSEKTEYPRQDITIQSLLACGAHYGHVVSYWCPKMAPFLYGTKSVHDARRGGSTRHIYIFNLHVTLQMWQKAQKAIIDVVSSGGTVLFVGTKDSCKDIIAEEAARCGMPYINHKWVGGTLTNFPVVKRSIRKLERLEKVLRKAADPDIDFNLTKKEMLDVQREVDKLEKKFGGIRSMKRLPNMVFCIDTKKSKLAIAEAKILRIPSVAVVDSNADPTTVDHVIPANDDATKTLRLFITNVADAALQGKAMYRESLIEQHKEQEG